MEGACAEERGGRIALVESDGSKSVDMMSVLGTSNVGLKWVKMCILKCFDCGVVTAISLLRERTYHD